MPRPLATGDMLLYIGNDVHLPLNEMAANQLEQARRQFQIPYANVVSLQTRKPALREDDRHIIHKSSLGRAKQILQLYTTLKAHASRGVRIVHLWGDGKPLLNSLLCWMTQQLGLKLCFSPTGRLNFKGPLPTHAHILFPHEHVRDTFTTATNTQTNQQLIHYLK